MKLNKRFLALLLAVTMMLGMLPVFAAAEDAPTCTCGTETEEHTTECALYQAPAEPTCTCGTETEEHTTECALYKAPEAPVCTCGTETEEHTTECALYKAPEAPVCTCGTETEEHTTECALYTEPTQPEKTFAQSLLELTSMEALYTALLAEENAASVQALSVAEVEALLDHNSALYAAIAEPADQDNTYLAGIVNCLVAVPAYVNRETEPTCTCGTETDEHTTECALYEEPTCTCGTETDEHTTECALYEEPTCTCGTETGEHTTECALYEEPICTCGTETEEHTDGCPLYVCVDCGKNPCECVVTPGVNFSNAAPLVSPVAKQSKLKTMFNFFKSTKEVTTTGKDVQGLETKKSVDFNPDTGEGLLTLEAWATGEKVTTEVVHAQPVDVVLVLDQSNTMYQYRSALMSVVNEFVGDLYEDVTVSGMDHRLAIVAFGNDSQNEGKSTIMTDADDSYNTRYSGGRRATAVLTYKNPSEPNPAVNKLTNSAAYGQFTTYYPSTYVWQHYIEWKTGATIKSMYANNTYSPYFRYAMHSLKDTEQSFFTGAVDSYLLSYTNNGGTNYEYGIMMADRVLADNSNVADNAERKKVVVFFTDGEPTPGTGDPAIEKAKTLKDEGVTVYTVGLLPNANGTVPHNFATLAEANQYLHALSSNYPNATSHTNPGTINSELNGKSYYLSATNSAGLSAAFKGITEEISSGGASITLDENAVLRDVISDQFELPTTENGEVDATKIKVYTAEMDSTTGEFKDKEVASNLTPSVSEDGKTVSVSGFDYADNWVGTDTDASGNVSYHGQKLIVEIPIKVREGFLGGIDVPTNADGSGVYENANATETLEDFISPTVSYPVPELTVTANDMMVKYGSAISEETLKSNVTVLVGGKLWSEYQDWQKAYLQEPEVTTDPASFDSVTARTTYTATATLKYLDGTVAKTAEDTGNIYIEKTAGALKTNKSAEFDQTTKTGILTLEAWATGESITTTNTTSAPLDIVLVLDQSTTMEYCVKCGGVIGTTQCNCENPVSRIDALRGAVSSFVDLVKQNATAETNHRIAFLGFASYGYEEGYNNTEIIYPEVSVERARDTHYQTALHDVTTDNGWESINYALAELTSDNVGGNTAAHAGFMMAKNVFDNNADSAGNRSKIVVFFTDGYPDNSNAAITRAKELKDMGVTIYSVGTFSETDQTENVHKFMNYTSSNYPDAVSLSDPGAPNEKQGYYMTVSDDSELASVFGSISQEITTGGSRIELDEKAVLKDVVSQYFELPENIQKSDIKVYTADYVAEGTFADREELQLTTDDITFDVNTKTVTVKGFNYSENWVGKRTSGSTTTYCGKKLIVEIPFVVRDGFLGGNGVPTNADGSGIYLDDTATETLEDFVSPEVNVLIGDIAITGLTDKNVYLLGGLTKEQILAGVSVTSGGKGIYDVEDWKKEFVNITTTEPENLTNLTVDTNATYTVTIAPKTTSTEAGAATTKTGSATVNVNVFKPTVTFQDGTVKYMNHLSTATYTNPVSTVWKHGTTLATPEIMTGDEPTLTFAYAAQSGVTDGKVTATDHVPMDVTSVKIVDTDVTTHVFFDHQACNPVCAWNGNDESEFWLHVTDTVGSLTITKSGVEREDEGAPFVFKITKDDFAMEVVVYGNSSVTIENLPVGTYTVKEITGYWRYTLASEQNADVGGGITKEVTFNNTLGIHKWLDDWANATNHFGS